MKQNNHCVVIGGIFSLHGQILGYALFVIGLFYIPFYIRGLKYSRGDFK